MKKSLVAMLFVVACGGGGKKQETTPTPLPENAGMGGDAYGGAEYGGGYGGDEYGAGYEERPRGPRLCPAAAPETGTLSEAEEMRRAENIVVALEKMAAAAQANKPPEGADEAQTRASCGAMKTAMAQTIRESCTALNEAKAMKSNSPELEAKYKGRIESAVGQLMEPMMACPEVGEMMGEALSD